MVERKPAKPRRRYIEIPGSETPAENTVRTFQIQVRAVGPVRQKRIGVTTRGEEEKDIKHPRRSDVAVGYRPVTGDNTAIPFKQDGIFPHEDDVPAFPRQGVVFVGLGNEITAARKIKTTRAYRQVPLGKGAVPGFRMPSKLEASRHLPPKLIHK